RPNPMVQCKNSAGNTIELPGVLHTVYHRFKLCTTRGLMWHEANGEPNAFLHEKNFLHIATLRWLRARLLSSISRALATLALSANVMAVTKSVRRGKHLHHPLRNRCSCVLIALIVVPAFC